MTSDIFDPLILIGQTVNEATKIASQFLYKTWSIPINTAKIDIEVPDTIILFYDYDNIVKEVQLLPSVAVV